MTRRTLEERSFRVYITESVRLALQGQAFASPWSWEPTRKDKPIDAEATIAALERRGAFEVTR